jgi:RimJ/RimL family protein N-acetyltransferase
MRRTPRRRPRSETWEIERSIVERGEESSVPGVTLRPIDDADLDALFEQMRDPESVRMAAFTTKDPDDRETFDSRMAKARSAPDGTMRAVIRDGRLVGSIASFVMDGETEITYWIDRSVWGQGIAGQALALFLDTVRVRPIYARAASDNVGSLKVLEGAGFRVIGTATSYANARSGEIEETILRLDERSD